MSCPICVRSIPTNRASMFIDILFALIILNNHQRNLHIRIPQKKCQHTLHLGLHTLCTLKINLHSSVSVQLGLLLYGAAETCEISFCLNKF